jgi:type VI secretion system protein ImpK
MQDSLANYVYPVLDYGIRLKERLDRNEDADFDRERATLKSLLTNPESLRVPEFGGDVDTRSLVVSRRSADSFLGIRYALVAWLDDIFILDSPWSRLWNERKLETDIYGTNVRAELFWDQARRAEARATTDALEAYYLCVMLGFRGELADHPEKVEDWAKAAQARISRGQGQEWVMPPELEPPVNVPPLYGRERMQRLVLVGGAFVLVLILIATVFIVLRLGQA